MEGGTDVLSSVNAFLSGAPEEVGFDLRAALQGLRRDLLARAEAAAMETTNKDAAA